MTPKKPPQPKCPPHLWKFPAEIRGGMIIHTCKRCGYEQIQKQSARAVRARRSLRERVFSRLIVDPSGCLLWTGFTVKGYGMVQVEGAPRYVHRLMYQWFTGPVPAGLELDHLCRVKHCAAPAHLEAVTHRDNLRRAGVGAHNAAKTHCPSGHPYDELNTTRRRGRRICRACNRQRHAASP